LSSVEKTTLVGVERIWHPCKIDCLALAKPEFSEPELQRTSQIFSAVYGSHFGTEKVIVNTDWYQESVYGVKHETDLFTNSQS
jgi:hypothetical protein